MTTMRAACLGAPVEGLALSTTCALAADTDDAAASAPVQAARAASGKVAGTDRVAGWHEQGRIVAGRLTGSYHTWQVFPHLRSATAYKLGPASGSQGWDGSQAWSTDSGGQVRIERGGEAAAQTIQGAGSYSDGRGHRGRDPRRVRD